MARLISWLLNIVYFAIVAVCSPLIVWQSLRTGKYREGYREKLFGLVPRRDGNATCVWIHAVSVGEVNLRRHPATRTAGGAPGLAIRRLHHAAAPATSWPARNTPNLSVFYCPLDFSWAVRTAMRRIRPTMLVLAELEVWPNLIMAAKRQARASPSSTAGSATTVSPATAASGRSSRASCGRSISSLPRTTSRPIAFAASALRPTASMSPARLKYDGAQTDRNNPRTAALRQLAGIADDDIVFLAGSTQEPEEQIVLEISVASRRNTHAYVDRRPAIPNASTPSRNLRLIILPWQRPLATSPPSQSISSTRRRAPRSSRRHRRRARRLLGHRKNRIRGRQLLRRGGHNMIEPAAYGAAVSFGPNTWNFRDIIAALRAADAAVVVETSEQLESFVRHCLEDPPYATALGTRTQEPSGANSVPQTVRYRFSKPFFHKQRAKFNPLRGQVTKL